MVLYLGGVVTTKPKDLAVSNQGARRDGQPNRGDSLTLAFERLREMIVSGQLSPGSRIIETELAERLGVSRTPVRGALQLLQREGLVNGAGTGSKQRMLVAPLTKEDSRELYSIVGLVEGLAGRLTAQLPASERERIVERLQSLNAGLEELARAHRRDPIRTFDLDRTFIAPSSRPVRARASWICTTRSNRRPSATGACTPHPSSISWRIPSRSTRPLSRPSRAAMPRAPNGRSS